MEIKISIVENKNLNQEITSLDILFRSFYQTELKVPSGLKITLLNGGKLLPNTLYSYRVSALNENGETFLSDPVQQTTTDIDLTLQISWDTVPFATKYRVYNNGNFIETTTNSITDDGTLSWTPGTPKSSHYVPVNLLIEKKEVYTLEAPRKDSLPLQEKISIISKYLAQSCNNIIEEMKAKTGITGIIDPQIEKTVILLET